MTAVYTTALAVGTTAGAGLTVPIGGIGDGWRFGIGSWAVFDVLAILPWLVRCAASGRAAVSRRGCTRERSFAAGPRGS